MLFRLLVLGLVLWLIWLGIQSLLNKWKQFTYSFVKKTKKQKIKNKKRHQFNTQWTQKEIDNKMKSQAKLITKHVPLVY